MEFQLKKEKRFRSAKGFRVPQNVHPRVSIRCTQGQNEENLTKSSLTAQGAIEEINMINTINFAATHESKQSTARAKLVFYPHSHWQVLRLGGHN